MPNLTELPNRWPAAFHDGGSCGFLEVVSRQRSLASSVVPPAPAFVRPLASLARTSRMTRVVRARRMAPLVTSPAWTRVRVRQEPAYRAPPWSATRSSSAMLPARAIRRPACVPTQPRKTALPVTMAMPARNPPRVRAVSAPGATLSSAQPWTNAISLASAIRRPVTARIRRRRTELPARMAPGVVPEAFASSICATASSATPKISAMSRAPATPRQARAASRPSR